MATALTFDFYGRDKTAGKAMRGIGDEAKKTQKVFGKVSAGISAGAARIGGGIVGVSKSFIGLTAAVAGAAGLLKFGQESIEEAREAYKVGRLTAQVIKTTGGAAKVTAKQVGDLAGALSNKAGVDDELVQSGANLLLTFKAVRNEAGRGNDIFNQGTQIALDMSKALGTDMKKSVIQVGKALNDPIKGVTALSKVGVSFNEQQKKQIKTLVESGNTLAAQKIILKELKSEFGGAAAVMADPADRAAVAWGNFKETLGTAFLPTYAAVMTKFSDSLPKILAVGGAIKDRLAPEFKRIGQAAQEGFGMVKPAIESFVTDAKGGFDAFVAGWRGIEQMPTGFRAVLDTAGGVSRDIFEKLKTDIGAHVESIRTRFGELVTQISGIKWPSFGGKIAEAFGDVGKKISEKLGSAEVDLAPFGLKLVDAAFGLAGKLVDGVKSGVEDGNWGPLGTSLGTAISDTLRGALRTGVEALGDLGEFARKLMEGLAKLDWIGLGIDAGKLIVPFFLGLLGGVGKVFGDDKFWSDLKKHWVDVVIGILTIIPIGRIAGLLTKVLSKIPFLRALVGPLEAVAKSGKLVEKLVGLLFWPFKMLGKAFLQGFSFAFRKVLGVGAGESLIMKLVAPLIRPFAKFGKWISDKLSTGWLHVQVWFSTLGERLGGALAAPLKTLGELGGKITGAVGGGIKAGLGWLGRQAGKIGGAITGAVSGAGKWLVSTGGKILRGLWGGISGVGKWLMEKTTGIRGWITERFTKAKDWLMSAGANILRGLWGGIGSLGKWLREKASGIKGWVTGRLTAANQWLYNTGRNILSGLWSGASSLGKWFREKVAGVKSWVVDRFSTAKDWLASAGRKLIDGLKTGLSEKLGKAKDWFKSIGKRIVTGVKEFFGIKSPSKVFMGLGGHLVTGLIKGMLNKNPTAAAKKVFGSMNSALRHMVDKAFIGLSGLSAKAMDVLFPAGSFGRGGKPNQNMKIAMAMMGRYGWGQGQWPPLRELWRGESGWNHLARNPSSGAYGIPQSLPASKMASAGADWRTNPATQIKWGLKYIADRYGTPMNAYSKWLNRKPHWYGDGGAITEPILGIGRSGKMYGFGERGETEWVVPDRKTRRKRLPIPDRQTYRTSRREPAVLVIDSAGSRLDDLLIEVLRGAIKNRGGDVQIVLGQR